MKRLLIAMFCATVSITAVAQTRYGANIYHAADCTAVASAQAGDECHDTDDDTTWTCEDDAATCTWVQTSVGPSVAASEITFTDWTDHTFGDNTDASMNWTFDPSGATANPTMSFADALITIGATNVTYDANGGVFHFNDGSGDTPTLRFTPQVGDAWDIFVQSTSNDLFVNKNTASAELFRLLNSGAGTIGFQLDGTLNVGGNVISSLKMNDGAGDSPPIIWTESGASRSMNQVLGDTGGAAKMLFVTNEAGSTLTQFGNTGAGDHRIYVLGQVEAAGGIIVGDPAIPTVTPNVEWWTPSYQWKCESDETDGDLTCGPNETTDENFDLINAGTGLVVTRIETSDGVLTDLKDGAHLTTGTVAEARIDSAIARLAGPALTGNPTAPTAGVDDSDTSIATTAFVQQEHDDSAGSCTNQVVTAVNANAAPTCANVGTAILADGTVDQPDIDDTDTLAGDPAHGNNASWFGTTGLIFEGATSDASEGLLTAADVGADRTWTLPDATGELSALGQSIEATEVAASLNTRRAAQIILPDPDVSDEFVFRLPPWTGTMTRIDCEVYGGTSVTIDICDGEDTGDDTCTTSIPGATMVCDTTGGNDTTLTNAGFVARDKLTLVLTAESGSVTSLEVYITATVD